MRGLYWHSECLGCKSYGIECEVGCEYDDDPGRRECFVPREDWEDDCTDLDEEVD